MNTKTFLSLLVLWLFFGGRRCSLDDRAEMVLQLLLDAKEWLLLWSSSIMMTSSWDAVGIFSDRGIILRSAAVGTEVLAVTNDEFDDRTLDMSVLMLLLLLYLRRPFSRSGRVLRVAFSGMGVEASSVVVASG